MEDILHIRGGEYELILYGVMLVLIMIFMPEGLTSGGVNLVKRLRQRRASGRNARAERRK
jgi:hypothetical protein